MKFISTSILLFLSLVTYSQDTVYCYSYQKGIITHTLESKITGYKLTPIDNPDLEIGLTKKEVRKIKYTSGKEFVNDNYGDTDVIPLSTEPTTGKIYYSEVVEFKGANTTFACNGAKGETGFTATLPPDILAADNPDVWQTNRLAAGGETGALLRKVIERAAALKHERDAPSEKPPVRKTARKSVRKTTLKRAKSR